VIFAFYSHHIGEIEFSDGGILEIVINIRIEIISDPTNDVMLEILFQLAAI